MRKFAASRPLCKTDEGFELVDDRCWRFHPVYSNWTAARDVCRCHFILTLVDYFSQNNSDWRLNCVIWSRAEDPVHSKWQPELSWALVCSQNIPFDATIFSMFAMLRSTNFKSNTVAQATFLANIFWSLFILYDQFYWISRADGASLVVPRSMEENERLTHWSYLTLKSWPVWLGLQFHKPSPGPVDESTVIFEDGCSLAGFNTSLFYSSSKNFTRTLWVNFFQLEFR